MVWYGIVEYMVSVCMFRTEASFSILRALIAVEIPGNLLEAGGRKGTKELPSSAIQFLRLLGFTNSEKCRCHRPTQPEKIADEDSRSPQLSLSPVSLIWSRTGPYSCL